jgi:hypothetical protein
MENEREWDEDVISNEQFRAETDEILARNKKYIVQEMMGEQYHNYFWDEKHAL